MLSPCFVQSQSCDSHCRVGAGPPLARPDGGEAAGGIVGGGRDLTRALLEDDSGDRAFEGGAVFHLSLQRDEGKVGVRRGEAAARDGDAQALPVGAPEGI